MGLEMDRYFELFICRTQDIQYLTDCILSSLIVSLAVTISFSESFAQSGCRWCAYKCRVTCVDVSFAREEYLRRKGTEKLYIQNRMHVQ